MAKKPKVTTTKHFVNAIFGTSAVKLFGGHPPHKTSLKELNLAIDYHVLIVRCTFKTKQDVLNFKCERSSIANIRQVKIARNKYNRHVHVIESIAFNLQVLHDTPITGSWFIYGFWMINWLKVQYNVPSTFAFRYHLFIIVLLFTKRT